MLKRITRAFILNRLHIIASAPAVMWCWSQFLRTPFRGIDYLIITLAVACICQWNRLTDATEDIVNCPDDLMDAQHNERGIKLFCYPAGVLTILAAFLTEPTLSMALLIAFGAAVGYFYNSSVRPSKPHLRLKNMFIVKNLSSGAGWSAGILVFPVMRVNASPDIFFFTALAYMFAMVVTYEIMWDIRDVVGDARAGIKTLPAVIGIQSARLCAVLLQIFCMAIILSGLASCHLPAIWSLHLMPNLVLLTMIIFFHRLIIINRNLSHLLVAALSIYAMVGGFLAIRFG